MNNEQQTQQADDPSGDGWRDVGPDEILQTGDMFWVVDHWEATHNAGTKSFRYGNGYRRRIEPQQPSDSDPGIVEDLRRRLAECEVLLAEAERSGQQVNAELQQLRKQLATSQHLAGMSRRHVADEAGKVEQLKQQLRELTQELKDKSDSYQMCLQSHYKAGQRSAIDKLQPWLRPVLELVAEHPEDASPLAVAVLGYLPGIASRLIEE